MKMKCNRLAAIVRMFIPLFTMVETQISRPYRPHEMCTYQNLDRNLLVLSPFLLASPGYPYSTKFASTTIHCECRISVVIDVPLPQSDNRILVRTVEIDVNNTPSAFCISEYVVTSYMRYSSQETVKLKERQCRPNNSTLAFERVVYHSYIFDHRMAGGRGKGTLHRIRHISKKIGFLYLHCKDLLATSTNDSGNNISDSAPIRNTPTRRDTKKYQILFVFGIATLGVFIIILAVIIIYLGMVFAKRRLRSIDIPQELRIHRNNIIPPLYALSGDINGPTDLYGDTVVMRAPLREPIAPPAYVEDPPKYESIFSIGPNVATNSQSPRFANNLLSIQELFDTEANMTDDCTSHERSPSRPGNEMPVGIMEILGVSKSMTLPSLCIQNDEPLHDDADHGLVNASSCSRENLDPCNNSDAVVRCPQIIELSSTTGAMSNNQCPTDKERNRCVSHTSNSDHLLRDLPIDNHRTGNASNITDGCDATKKTVIAKSENNCDVGRDTEQNAQNRDDTGILGGDSNVTHPGENRENT